MLAPCSALKRLWSECLDTLDRNLARIEQLEHLNLFSPSRDIMKPEPKPPNWEVLAGMVERVTYHNAENGFCVVRVKARGHRELVTVVRHAAAVSAGEWITATGEWCRATLPTANFSGWGARKGSHGSPRKRMGRSPKAITRGRATRRARIDLLSRSAVYGRAPWAFMRRHLECKQILRYVTFQGGRVPSLAGDNGRYQASHQ